MKDVCEEVKRDKGESYMDVAHAISLSARVEVWEGVCGQWFDELVRDQVDEEMGRRFRALLRKRRL
jgi:DNA-binding cell septation regulator SpoVG